MASTKGIPVWVDRERFDSVSAAARHLGVNNKVFANTLEIREAYGREINYKGHIVYAAAYREDEHDYEVNPKSAPGLAAFLEREPLERRHGRLLSRVIVRA